MSWPCRRTLFQPAHASTTYEKYLNPTVIMGAKQSDLAYQAAARIRELDLGRQLQLAALEVNYRRVRSHHMTPRSLILYSFHCH